MFSDKDGISKEAELTNQEKEWERKVQSNDWVKDVMEIDEVALAKEAAAKQAAEEQMSGVAEPFDEVGAIMAFEQGDLGNEEILKLFSELIKNGHAWSLQGSYGRAAKSLIDQGYLDEQGTILKDIENEAPEEVPEQRGTDRPDWDASKKQPGVKKIAAYEKGDTREETIEKDYEIKVKGLSDYNLAEMIAEYECIEKGVATLSHNEYKEDAMKSVASGRDAAEKKLVKFLGNHTLVDWKKSFKELEDSEVKHAAEKDLYSEWKEGKMAWESKTKFDATTDKEKLEQMEGVGKEEEKGQVGKEASKTEFVKCPTCDSKTARKHEDGSITCVTCGHGKKDKEASLKVKAASPVEIIEKKVDKLIKDTIDKKFEEMAPTVPVVDPMAAPMPGVPTVVEDSPEDKLLDKLDVPHSEPGETPEHEKEEVKDLKKEDKKEEPKEASLKTADELMDDVRENDPLHGKPAPKPPQVEEKEAAPPATPAPVTLPQEEHGYQGWKNYETWIVALWLDNDEGMYRTVIELAKSSKGAGDLGEKIKQLVEESQPDLGASMYADLISNSMRSVDWYEVGGHFEEDIPAETSEVEEAPAEPEASMGEIQPHASKKEVLKKVAEIESPWKVVKNDRGEEIIARVAPVATEKISKEKEKELGINSQDAK
jgi:hypothetical protein